MAFVPICTVFCLFRACRMHIDGVHTGGIMRHVLALSTLLSAFWLINSGHYNSLLIFFMIVSVAFVVLLCNRMDVVDGESQPLNLTFSIPTYWIWLIKEVVISNFDVAGRVWRGNESISPRLITVTAHQKTDIAKVIYANSITLTPGTVSADLEGDQITVHALTKESAAGLLTGEMDRRVCLVER